MATRQLAPSMFEDVQYSRFESCVWNLEPKYQTPTRNHGCWWELYMWVQELQPGMGLCTGPLSNLEFGCNWLIGLHNPTTIYIHTSETKQWKLTWNPSWCIVKVATFQENIYENPQCFLEKEMVPWFAPFFLVMSPNRSKSFVYVWNSLKFLILMVAGLHSYFYWYPSHSVVGETMVFYPCWNLPAKQVPNNCDACLATTAFTKAASTAGCGGIRSRPGSLHSGLSCYVAMTDPWCCYIW